MGWFSIDQFVAVHRVMEDLLQQIIRESQNSKLSNVRKAAQDAYGNFLQYILQNFLANK